MSADVPIRSVTARAFTIPTDEPESDGTLAWDSTTIVVVETFAAGERGLGYTYTSSAAATVVRNQLAPAVEGRNALDVAGAWVAMAGAARNLGRPGVAAAAISAVDVSLWDLKARLLGVPVAVALDAVHQSVPIYGSGGSRRRRRVAPPPPRVLPRPRPRGRNALRRCPPTPAGRVPRTRSEPSRSGHRAEGGRRRPVAGDAVTEGRAADAVEVLMLHGLCDHVAA